MAGFFYDGIPATSPETILLPGIFNNVLSGYFPAMPVLYDTIGVGYAGMRRPDPRIAQAIKDALGDTKTVLNVGAGTGSYEPEALAVTAIEPSAEMINQRPVGAAPVVQGVAENLPFEDDAFDAAMAVLTVHHWRDVKAGLQEMRRVTKGPVVILTFDPAGPYFWLADYMPEIIVLDQPIMPPMEIYERILGQVRVEPVPIPHDCTDGFLGAYWRRPHMYLDPHARAAVSTFAKIDGVDERLEGLKHDLASGVWEERYGHIMALDSLDIGYRLIVST